MQLSEFYLHIFIISIFLFQTASWIPFLCAVGLFVYQTLDAIDGKQVRNLPEKVRTSSV